MRNCCLGENKNLEVQQDFLSSLLEMFEMFEPTAILASLSIGARKKGRETRKVPEIMEMNDTASTEAILQNKKWKENLRDCETEDKKECKEGLGESRSHLLE